MFSHIYTHTTTIYIYLTLVRHSCYLFLNKCHFGIDTHIVLKTRLMISFDNRWEFPKVSNLLK